MVIFREPRRVLIAGLAGPGERIGTTTSYDAEAVHLQTALVASTSGSAEDDETGEHAQRVTASRARARPR